MAYRLTQPHRRRGVLYQAGEFYHPTSAELRAFPDRFEQVQAAAVPKDVEEDAPAPEPASRRYDVVHRGGGWYDVVDTDGNAQNDAPMRMSDAETLRQDLLRKHK